MSDNSLKVKMVAYRVAFLMEHQQIISNLKEILNDMIGEGPDSEYLLGAFDALNTLISALEEKGE